MKSKSKEDKYKKWLKNVESAGTSANAFGWLLLVLFPLLILLLSSSSDYETATVLIIWFIGLPIFGFYIYSGKYIKSLRVSSIGGFLLFNAITGLLLFQGIIPLILSIQSFIGYYSFRKLKKVNNTIGGQDEEEWGQVVSTLDIVLFTIFALVGTFIIVGALSNN